MNTNTFYALLSVALVILVGFLMLSFSTVNRGDNEAVTDLRVIDLTPQVPADNTTNIDVSPTVTTPAPVASDREVDEISSEKEVAE